MSRVSRTTLEKRQLLSIIGAGAGRADQQNSTATAANNSMMASYLMTANRSASVGTATTNAAGGGGAAVPSATNQSYQSATAGGCGCEAFEPITDAAQVAFPDGAFPAFIQTACLVTYRNAEVAKMVQQQALDCYNGAFTSNLSGTNNGGESFVATDSAPSGQSSPQQQQRTKAKIHQPIYVEDDEYDKEVDAYEAREAQRNPTDREDAKQKKEASYVSLTNEAPVEIVSEVWTAEADGTISIRNPINGRNCKGQPRIPAFGRLSQALINGGGNCFVTAMIQVRDYVFAGYVDGMVRVFDVLTKELVFEKRKHAGSVTAIAQWKENIVFTASDDFRIMMWRVGVEKAPDANLRAKRAQKEGERHSSPLTTASHINQPAMVVNIHKGTTVNGAADASHQLLVDFEGPSFLHQLQGHAGRIHALHVEGDYLYSGGDEGLIKCWDIRSRSEVINNNTMNTNNNNSNASQQGKDFYNTSLASAAANPSHANKRFPLQAHSGGVRDITSCQSVLITAGKGGVCLFDIETCEEMKRFTNFADVNRILVDPTSLVLWVCCSNTGTVTLIDLYTFREIGVIADFSAATIKNINTVSTSQAARLFMGSKGKGLSVAYCEGSTTGMRKHYTPINTATEAKYRTLDVLRDEIMSNEDNLESYRKLLWSIRDTDQYHKHKASQIFEQGNAFQQQKMFLERCILFVIMHRHCSRQLTIATALERGCQHRLRFTALLKWFLFRRSARDARFKEFVTTSLTKEHERQMIGKQLQNVMTFMVMSERHRTRRLIAPIFEQYQVRRCIIAFFIKWRRWVQMKHAANKQRLVVGYFHNCAQQQTKLLTYRKLASYMGEAQFKTLHIKACVGLQRTNQGIMLKRYFGEWLAHRVNRRKQLQLTAMSRLVADHYEVPIRRKYFDLLWANATDKIKARASENLKMLTERIDFMQTTIAQEEATKKNLKSAKVALKAAAVAPTPAAAAAPAAATTAAADGPQGGEVGETVIDTTLSPTNNEPPLSATNADDTTDNTEAEYEAQVAAEVETLDAEIARLEKEIEDTEKGNANRVASIVELSYRESRLLIASGVAPNEVASQKAIPKRRAEAGEPAAEVGALEGIVAKNASATQPHHALPTFTDAFKSFNSHGTDHSNATSNNNNANANAETEMVFGDEHAGAAADNGNIISPAFVSPFSSGAVASNFAICDAAIKVIKASGFNLRTARAEIVRRHKKPAGSTKGEPPLQAFAQAVEAFYTAIKPLTEEKDALEIGELWSLDDAKPIKASALKKVIGPAHDVLVAWEYVRNLRSNTHNAINSTPAGGSANNSFHSNNHHASYFDDDAVPNVDVLARNVTVLNRLFTRALAGGVGGGDLNSSTGSPLVDRNTPLQTPLTSRNVSPNPSRRATTPSRTVPKGRAPSVGASSPALKKPVASATGRTATTSASTARATSTGPTTKPKATTTTATKTATASSTTKRSTSPSVSRVAASPIAKPSAKPSTVATPSRATTTTAAKATTTPRAAGASAAKTTTVASPVAARRSPTPTTSAASPVKRPATASTTTTASKSASAASPRPRTAVAAKK